MDRFLTFLHFNNLIDDRSLHNLQFSVFNRIVLRLFLFFGCEFELKFRVDSSKRPIQKCTPTTRYYDVLLCHHLFLTDWVVNQAQGYPPSGAISCLRFFRPLKLSHMVIPNFASSKIKRGGSAEFVLCIKY